MSSGTISWNNYYEALGIATQEVATGAKLLPLGMRAHARCSGRLIDEVQLVFGTSPVPHRLHPTFPVQVAGIDPVKQTKGPGLWAQSIRPPAK